MANFAGAHDGRLKFYNFSCMRKENVMRTVPLNRIILNVLLLIAVTVATQASAAEPGFDKTRLFKMGPNDSHVIGTEIDNLPAGARILLTITSNHDMYKMQAFGPPPDDSPKDSPSQKIAENNGTELDCKTIKAGLHKICFEPVGGDWRKTYQGRYRIRVWKPEKAD